MGFPVAADNSGMRSALNLSGTTVLKVGPGFVYSVSAGAATLSVYDGASAADVAAGNLIATVAIASTAQINFPFFKGLVVGGTGPGAVSFS